VTRSIWVVIPTFNEAANVERVIAATEQALATVADAEPHVLIVDDSSPDGTGAIVERLAAADAMVAILHRAKREGLGPAYLAGFAYALEHGADLVFEMDADFSHDPADLPRLVAAIDEGADLALGSRYVDGGAVAQWGPLRRLVSRGACLYARLVLGLPVRDLTGGFKCFRRSVLESIDLGGVRSHGYVFQIELTLRAIRRGFRVVEVPIIFRDREFGKSKMSTRIALEAAWLVPQLRLRDRTSSRG
jgi:dolichol-phosphate mannosyltransferase